MKRTRHFNGWLCRSSLLCCLLSTAVFAEEFSWNSATHQLFEADLNQDGYNDLLLQAKVVGQKHYFVPGQTGAKQRFDYANRIELPQKLADLPWTADQVQLLPIKLLNKVGQSLLVLPKNAEKALLLNQISSGADLAKVAQTYELKQNKWLQESTSPVYFAGDFDGDGQQDLLQLDAEKGSHQVILLEKNQKLKTAKKLTKTVQWGLKNNERLIIRDFNKDGQDDVFALSRDGKQPHVLLYSDGKGGFSQEDGKLIPVNQANLHWSDNSSGITSVIRKSDKQTVLFRAYNHAERNKQNAACLGWVFDTESVTAKEYCPSGIGGNNVGSLQASDEISGDCPIEMALPGTYDEVQGCDGGFIVPNNPTSAPSVSGGPFAPGAQFKVFMPNTYDALATTLDLWLQDQNGGYLHLGDAVVDSVSGPASVSIYASISTPGTYSLMYRGCAENGCSGFGPSTTVTIQAPQVSHTVTASAGAGGTISPTSRSVPNGQTTTFTVTPNAGYTAAASGCGGSLSGTTYTTGAITGACTVSATFTANTYTVTANAGSNGSITPPSRLVPHGQTTTFTVTPNAGFTAAASGCGGSLSGTTYTTGAITGACTVSATFSAQNAVVTATAGSGGTITPTSRTVPIGQIISFTITPNAGYTTNVSHNCGGGNFSGTTLTVGPITGNCAVSATFSLQSYTVSTSAGANGSISAGKTVNHGQSTTFTVTPNAGYTASASGCGGSLSGTTYTTGVITAACTVSATFSQQSYAVSTSAGANGSISAGKTVNHGQSTTFTVTPNAGYTAAASGCGGSLSGTTYTTGSITSACTVSASFSQTPSTPDPVTLYEYDARGRMIKVNDNLSKSSTYVLDNANNRLSVSDQTAPVLAPKITSFAAPASVNNVGDSALISWTSTDTTHCAIKIFGDYSTYPNLPKNGSVNVTIYENTGMTLTCYYSSLSASTGRVIRVLNGVPN